MLKSLRESCLMDYASSSQDWSSQTAMLFIFLGLGCRCFSFQSQGFTLLLPQGHPAIIFLTSPPLMTIGLTILRNIIICSLIIYMMETHTTDQSSLYSSKLYRKMWDNPGMEFDPRRLREQAELKVLREVSQRLLPRGCCVLEENKKYEYIRAFLKDRFVYRYIVPINHVYAPFVVICRKPQGDKYPLYQLYHRPTSSFVLSAQEQTMSIGCNYLISTKQKPSKNEFFIAKLRSNFSRNQFNIFDNGKNPERAQGNPRRQLGFITVGESALWSKEERLTMYVPRAYESNRSISEIHKYEPIEFLCQTSNPNPILQDFKEKYNTVQSLHLKEKGKGTGTGKQGEGFVLESSVRTETVVVRRKSETFFELGIGSPLTIVQGLGFLLAMVQAKLI